VGKIPEGNMYLRVVLLEEEKQYIMPSSIGLLRRIRK